MPSEYRWWFCRKAGCPQGLFKDRESGRGDGELRCPSCGGPVTPQEVEWIYKAMKGGSDAWTKQ